MTDRVPGAPGQFQALITAGALAKMQSGEAFPIILTRDDQPITEGTPYSKAAVLPDALAQKLCPGNPDPTPADALAALLPATHAADKDNPHGVTPAQIGAMANTSAAWLPQNGMSIRDFPDGITMYSVHPGNMVAEGAPDGFSGYATVTAFRYAEYDYYEYTDVFGKKAIWNTNDNSGWQRVYTDNHKPTAADVGAAPAGHDHSGVLINPAAIEIIPPVGSSHGGFIDFHYGGSTEDHTSRIIETDNGIDVFPALLENGNRVYSAANKPAPADIGAMPSGFSGAIYADPNGGTTSLTLPDVTETRNYLGIIRGLNPAYTAVYAFCGYQNSHYWAVPIKEHQYIGVSAQNGNTVTVTNNTGHSALYVRMIDMSII